MASRSKKQPNKRMLLLLSILGAVIVIVGIATFAAPGRKAVLNYAGAKSTVDLKVISYYGGAPIEGVRVEWLDYSLDDRAIWATGTTTADGKVTLSVPKSAYGRACLYSKNCGSSCRLIDASQDVVSSTQQLYRCNN